jgi:hypothetical protein
VERVVAGTADQGIGARFTPEIIVSIAAVQIVTATAAEQEIVTIAPIDLNAWCR